MGKHMQSDCNNNKHCSNHDQDGHTFSECYSKGGGSEGKGPQQKRKVKWMMKDKESEEKKGSESTHQVLTLEQCNVAFASREPELIFVKDEWLADSGSSTHLATKREMFRDFIPTTGILNGINENNSTTSYGRGTVILHSKINGKIIPITLHNVLFVPDAANCLFSIGKVYQAGGRAKQKNGSIQIYDASNNLVLQGHQSHSVYVLEAKVAPQKETINTMISWNEAHRRYGHISQLSLKTIIIINLYRDSR